MTGLLAACARSVCSDDAAHKALNDVYSAPAFRDLGKAPQENFFSRIGHVIENVVNAIFRRLGTGGSAVLLILFLALVLGYILWKLRGRMAGRALSVSTPAAEVQTLDSEAEWRAAEAAAKDGEYREAVRRAFRAALLAVAAKGRLIVDSAWTNRELLQHCEADGDLLAQLAPAAATFELAWYSRAETTKDDWDVARARCRAIRELALKKPVTS